LRLFYFSGQTPNFGDDLNPWIWPKLLDHPLDDDDGRLFLGIGTIINDRLPHARRYIVFSSGVGYGALPPNRESFQFVSVRGPESARRLSLPEDIAVTDGAILLNAVDCPPPRPGGIAFIPHAKSLDEGPWEEVCYRAGINLIDPRENVETVLAEIRGARGLIAEAMHGAIVADTFRVPWTPVITRDFILPLKWRDWAESMELPYQPTVLPSVIRPGLDGPGAEHAKARLKRLLQTMGVWSANWTPPYPPPSPEHQLNEAATALSNLAHTASWHLSDDRVFTDRFTRLRERLAGLNA
jgi:succinoglycan biosynthesis protein ExoV